VAELSEQPEQEIVETKKAHRSRSGSWFPIVILLVIVGLTGAGFYLFTQLRERQEGLGGELKDQVLKQIADYQDQLVAIQNQLAALETNIGSKDSHFTKTLDDFSRLHNEKLESTRKELYEAIGHLQRQLGKTRGDWLVADAEYLLSIANERLHLIGDINTTREALEAADQRLRESGDAGVFKVREQIAKDIALIRTIQAPDIVGIYASLQSMGEQVQKLTLLLPYSGKPLSPSNVSQEPTDNPEESNSFLDSASSVLKGIVTIKHAGQSVKEILTPEQAEFIREQLHVKLEMIKIALVEHNEPIYQSSIADAKKWVEQHFADNTEFKAVIDELNRLALIKIRGQYPDISLSHKMLRDITKLRLETDKGQNPNKITETAEPNSSKPISEPSTPVEAVEPSSEKPTVTE
jgi:uroporphyrin-3 C-methyltransferase/uroporphyrinogen III methyltransferase/synthase